MPVWQVSAVVLVWGYICLLHTDNDGLWDPDSSKHFANGVFWGDYLRDLSPDPKGFALSYYARYPVIAPTYYPPAFYLLEAATFAVFGASPYVAKGLVLAFLLVAALYSTAWLRRWLSPGVGWFGALLPLMPIMILKSHAIMLNVPACACRSRPCITAGDG